MRLDRVPCLPADEAPLQVQPVFSARQLELVAIELQPPKPADLTEPHWAWHALQQLAANRITQLALHLRLPAAPNEAARALWDSQRWPQPVRAAPQVDDSGETVAPGHSRWADAATLQTCWRTRVHVEHLARSGAQVWVIGIDNERELRLAVRLGAAYVQGDLLGRACDAASLRLRFREARR